MSVKNIPYTESTTETVEMTELDGMEHGAVLRYMDLGGPSKPCSTREVKTTMGDLYVIVNALRDYANLLESAVYAWGLTGKSAGNTREPWATTTIWRWHAAVSGEPVTAAQAWMGWRRLSTTNNKPICSVLWKGIGSPMSFLLG